MPNVRAFLASVGAGGSIAIAGVITLLSVSAVIAVGNWRGPARADGRGSAPLVVPADASHPVADRSEAAVATVADATPVVMAARPGRIGTGGKRASGDDGGTGTPSSSPARSAPKAAEPTVASSAPGQPTTAPSPAAAPDTSRHPTEPHVDRRADVPARAGAPTPTPAPALPSRPATPVTPAVPSVPDTAQSTAPQVAGATSRVPAPAQQVVQSVGQAVPAAAPVTDTANQVVGSVPDTVDQVGNGAGQLLGGLTGKRP